MCRLVTRACLWPERLAGAVQSVRAKTGGSRLLFPFVSKSGRTRSQWGEKSHTTTQESRVPLNIGQTDHHGFQGHRKLQVYYADWFVLILVVWEFAPSHQQN